MAAMAARRLSGETALIEVKALGVFHRADLDAETLVDARTAAEGELGTAAAGIEDDQRAGSKAPRPERAPR
jgi:hypothetical protein